LGAIGGAGDKFGFPAYAEDDMNTDRAVFVYTTYPSIVEAEEAGRALVEQRLCACVNILPGMVSYYWWQGSVERGEEAVMIVKTRAELSERVATAIKEMHSYSVPAIIVVPLESRASTSPISNG
jgi:periplasmic divalent cation tolerance protein